LKLPRKIDLFFLLLVYNNKKMENIQIEIVEPEYTQVYIGFTRYLYLIDDVKSSLLLSILDRKREVAMYWGYELYFSGITEETFTVLINMADTMYDTKSARFVANQYELWATNKDHYWILGTMIWYLCESEYDANAFVKEYCKNEEILKKCTPKPHTSPKRRVIVIMQEKDVMQYVNIEIDKPRYLLTLSNLVKYPIRNYCANLFENAHTDLERDELIGLYRENWLYFACASPLWYKRVRKYGGNMDHLSEKVVFDDEEKEDVFYAKYYYDPDEQPAHILELHLGKDAQWTWNDFCELYCK
jgi:hypothetical protein